MNIEKLMTEWRKYTPIGVIISSISEARMLETYLNLNGFKWVNGDIYDINSHKAIKRLFDNDISVLYINTGQYSSDISYLESRHGTIENVYNFEKINFKNKSKIIRKEDV